MYLGGKMKSFIVLFILTAVLTLSAVQTETRNFRTFLYGNDSNFTYNNWLSHVSEATISPNGDIYAPFDRQLNNFGGYDTGTSYLNIWESAVDNFCNGNFDQAHQILTDATLPFEVVQMIDTATNRDYYVLREIPDMSFVDNNDTPNVEYDDEIGAFVKGWGLAVYNPYSSNSVVISVVQPGDDFITVPLAFEAFEKTDARYLLINGAGREVNPDYSDPSRNNSHPFNRIYRSACDEIRSTFGRREFSLQLHSFDYNNNLPVDVLLSSGRARPTGLPIYDFSSHHFDIVNSCERNIFSPNTVGNPFTVKVEDYITIMQIPEEAYIYYNDTEPVSLTFCDHQYFYGWNDSFQYIYTTASTDRYSRQKNWLTVEMNESPNCVPDYENFYLDSDNQTAWNHRYDNAITYYGYWLDKLAEVLPASIMFEDGNLPPSNVTFTDFNHEYYEMFNRDIIRFNWTMVDDFNFERYVIEVSSDEQFSNIYYTYTDTLMQLPYRTYKDLVNFPINQRNYFRLKAYDTEHNVTTSNTIYIDPDFAQDIIAEQPQLVYTYQTPQVSLQNQHYIVEVANTGNSPFRIDNALDLDYPFSCPALEKDNFLVVYPGQTRDVEINLTGSLDRPVKSTFSLNTNAPNATLMTYTLKVVNPYHHQSRKINPELILSNGSSYIAWDDRGRSAKHYTIYQSDRPDKGFVQIGQTQKNRFPVDKSDSKLFYIVIPE
jgi:hypothetical protein